MSLALVLAVATQITASSGPFHAVLSYTMRPSGFIGEADFGPYVRDGTLTISRKGRRSVVISLNRLGIHDAPTVFEIDPQQACGGGAPLSFVRSSSRPYLAIQSVWVGKGCRPVLHLVDLGSMAVVPEIAIDHAYAHRYDVPAAETFAQKAAVRITALESLNIPTAAPVASPLSLTIIRGRANNSSPFAAFAANLSRSSVPERGEIIYVGFLDATASAPVIRLSAKHEQTWVAQQRPMSAMARRRLLYNEYFMYSGKLAERGQLVNALAAYKRALSYLDDRDMYLGESARIPKLEKLIRDVKTGVVPLVRAKDLWFRL